MVSPKEPWLSISILFIRFPWDFTKDQLTLAKEYTILTKNDRAYAYRTKILRSLFGSDSAVGRIQAVYPVVVKSEGRLDFSARGEEDKRTDHDVLEGE